MSKYWSLAVSIGLLGGIDTYLIAAFLPIPVWVTFIAWASFFACSGGSAGFFKSMLSNWTGIVIAALAMLVGAAFGYVSEVLTEFLTKNPPQRWMPCWVLLKA